MGESYIKCHVMFVATPAGRGLTVLLAHQIIPSTVSVCGTCKSHVCVPLFFGFSEKEERKLREKAGLQKICETTKVHTLSHERHG